jgi:hypothetical protein
VQKYDPAAVHTPAWLLVDRLKPGGSAARESGIEIGHAETDVMDARAALLDEFVHGAVGLDWLEQFDVDSIDRDGDDV